MELPEELINRLIEHALKEYEAHAKYQNRLMNTIDYLIDKYDDDGLYDERFQIMELKNEFYRQYNTFIHDVSYPYRDDSKTPVYPNIKIITDNWIEENDKIINAAKTKKRALKTLSHYIDQLPEDG